MKPHHINLKALLLPGAVLLTATAPLTSRADYQSTVLSFNPLAYYRLSETAPAPPANVATNYGSLGRVGTGYIVSLDPRATVTNGLPGIVGSACRFVNVDGAGGQGYQTAIDVPWRPELNPNGPFSVELWANPTRAVASGNLQAAISSINGSQSRSGWILYQAGGTGNGNWEFRIGGLGSYAGTIDSAPNSVAVGGWQHIVLIYDGASISMYINGTLAAGPTLANGGAGFNPNNSVPFRLGASGLGNRGYDGLLDEVAFYNYVLSPSTIAAHHSAATTNNAGYQAQILLDNPLGYWHLDEPLYVTPDPSTFPVTANLGSLGAAANGTNNPGLLTGIAGPPYLGFGANNIGVDSGYSAGNVDLGAPAGLNFSGQITMMAWINPTFTDGLRDIVAHGFSTNGEVFMRINSGNYEVGSWDGTTTYSVTGAMNTGGLGSDIGNWVFIAATYDGANWNLYRYDNLVTNAPFGTGAMVFDAPWSIASAGPNSEGRFLGGGVDEVAIFNTALTTAQIQQIFYSASVAPVIVTPLASQVSPPVYAGNSLNLVVAAEGNKPLSYLWTKNGVSLGNTTTSLSINNLQTTDSGTYAVVVTNPSGSTTSSVPVNVLLLPPQITQQPVSTTRFVGASPSFSVSVVGSAPLTYQWKSNNVAISGATSSSLTLNNVQLSYAANYSCTINGPGGVTNSAAAALTVLTDPAHSYPLAVIADGPMAFWRLGESSGTVAYDYWGGHNGTYHNVALGQPGYAAVDPDTAVGFGAQDDYMGNVSGIDFSGPGKSFTIELWVNGPASQINGAGLVSKGTGQNGTGGANAFQFSLDVTGGFYRFHVEPTSGTASDATATVGPDGGWHHLAAVYDAAGATMTLYVDGQVSGSAGAVTGGPLSTAVPISVGAAQGGVTPVHDLYFTGTLDEVAIYNYALSGTQVANHYAATYGNTTAPFISVQPTSVTNFVTYPATFAVSAAGSVPLTYQWYKGNTALFDTATITGSGTRALTINPLDLTDSGSYHCQITNVAGVTNSATVTLTVLSPPTTPIAIPGLVLHLPFDNTLSDATGRGNNGTPHGSPTFVTDGKLGQALHYETHTVNDTSGSNVTSAAYVSLGVIPDLQFSSNVNFSVSYWIRLPAFNGVGDEGDLPFFTDTVGSTFGFGYVFAPSYKLGGWAFSLFDAGGNGQGVYGASYSIDDGFWHHLVHTFDRQRGVVNYLDGVVAPYTNQAGSTIVAAGNIDNGQSATIGQDPTGLYTEPGSGDIDDLGVWKKALTPLEVEAIYLGAISNGVSFVGAPVTLTKQVSGGNMTLSWTAGTLQAAGAVTGPYTNVTPTSPYVVPLTGPQRYFRTKL